MNEKTTIPVIVDTVLIDDHYEVERRSGRERRKKKLRWKGYDRRISDTLRRGKKRTIDEKV
ncbi:hypothetical protein ACPV5I_18145 [Vibrio gigantis]